MCLINIASASTLSRHCSTDAIVMPENQQGPSLLITTTQIRCADHAPVNTTTPTMLQPNDDMSAASLGLSAAPPHEPTATSAPPHLDAGQPGGLLVVWGSRGTHMYTGPPLPVGMALAGM